MNSKTRKIALWLIDNSRWLFWLSIIFAIFATPVMTQIKKDFSYKAFYRENDPYLLKYLEYEKSFGNDDKVVVLVTNKKSFLNESERNKIKTLHRALEKAQHVVGVQSLFNFPRITEKDDEIIISNFLDLESEKILNEPEVNRFLISKDGKVLTYYLSLKSYFKDKPNYSIPVDSVKSELSQLDLKGLEYSYTGTAALMDAVKKYTIQDLKLLLPLVIFIIFLISYLLFRNIIVSVLTLVLITMTIIITLAMGKMLGIQLSSTTALIPQILLAICILDAIHIFSYFSLKSTIEGFNNENLIETIRVNLIPTLLTSLTTSLGFFSLCFSDLRPVQDLGTLCSLGVMIAWFLSFAFLPHCIKKNRARFQHFNITLSRIDSKRFVEFIARHKHKIVIFCGVLFLVSLEIASRNVVDADTLNFFKKGSQVRTDYEYALKKVGGVKGIELLLSDKENVLTRENFQKLKRFEERLIKLGYITNVRTIRRELEKVFHLIVPNSKRSFYELDEGDYKELVFAYELASTNENSIWSWITNDYSKLKINVLWTLSGNKNSLAAIKEIKKLGKKIGLNLTVTGKTSLVVGINDYLVKTILSSISLAIIALTLLMGYFTKSLRVGIATMIPNIFPIVIVAALATLVGININMGSVLVASICLGIAIDDTIHFCYHYYQIEKEGKLNQIENITEIINSTGKSLISTTMILVCCFIVFIFSNVVINIEFGVLTTLVLILALFCDFVILPAIMLNRSTKRTKA